MAAAGRRRFHIGVGALLFHFHIYSVLYLENGKTDTDRISMLVEPDLAERSFKMLGSKCVG